MTFDGTTNNLIKSFETTMMFTDLTIRNIETTMSKNPLIHMTFCETEVTNSNLENIKVYSGSTISTEQGSITLKDMKASKIH
jgi:hypothetical protein